MTKYNIHPWSCGGNKMKKLLFGTILLALVSVFPTMTRAEVDINIGITLPLPPLIVFPAPPEVVVIPDTYVYVVPDVEVDIFFYGGWWWRPWEGRWYRSRHYDRGWVYYRYIPYFYYDIDFGWRGFYRDRHWHGNPWVYQRIPYPQLQKNWRAWHNNRYWERERKWNVEKYQPPPPQRKQELRRRRQYEYGRRPDVQKHEQWRREQQRKPDVRKPQGPPQSQQPRKGSPHPQPHGKPQGGGPGPRK
jgi:hypothetical protein